MKTTIDVQTGKVEAAGKETILRSNAIASCIVIVAYDPMKRLGALAHVMVPGVAPAGRTAQRTRYAADAIKEMMNRIIELGANEENIGVCLVGGGNVLKKKDDSICQANIESVTSILTDRGLNIQAKDLGGMLRRNVTLDVEKGTVRYTVGDGKEQLLWKFAKDSANESEQEDGSLERC